MKPHCPDGSQLSAFADGELGRQAAARMEAHLAHCDRCRKLLRAYQAADRRIDDLPEVSVSAAFESGLRERLDALAEGPREMEPLKWRLSGWRPVWTFGVAICLVAGIFLYNRFENQAPSTEEVVNVENLEFFRDFELIQKLELLEGWDRIEAEPETEPKPEPS